MRKKFRKECRTFQAVFAALFVAAAISGRALAGTTISIVGTVSGYSIQTEDGQEFELGDTPKGNEVAGLSGKRVSVTGTLEEDEYGKVINVSSYSVLPDPGDENTTPPSVPPSGEESEAAQQQ